MPPVWYEQAYYYPEHDTLLGSVVPREAGPGRIHTPATLVGAAVLESISGVLFIVAGFCSALL